ncbi:hypothetical protein EVA_15720, partial [gut metagenome]
SGDTLTFDRPGRNPSPYSTVIVEETVNILALWMLSSHLQGIPVLPDQL